MMEGARHPADVCSARTESEMRPARCFSHEIVCAGMPVSVKRLFDASEWGFLCNG